MVIKNIGRLFSASIFAQILQLLAQPTLAKIFSPADFALLGQITSISTILVVFANLQIHNCLTVSPTAEERGTLLAVGFTWITTFSALLFLMMYASHLIFGWEFATFELALYSAVTVWVLGSANVMLGFFSGENRFSLSAKFTMSRSVLVVISQSAMGFAGASHGLILGLFCGEFLTRVAISRAIIKNLNWKLHEGICILIKKYSAYIGIGTIQDFVSVLVLMAPLYFLSTNLPDDLGGSYAFAYRMSWAPALLVGGAISPVLLRTLSAKPGDGSVSVRIYVISVSIFLASVVAINYIMIPLLRLWLDSRWVNALEMISYLSIWISAYLGALFIRQYYRIYRMQRWQLLVDACVAVCLVAVFLIENLGWRGLVALTSALGLVQNLTLVCAYRYFSRRTAKF